jgi:NAD+ synthase
VSPEETAGKLVFWVRQQAAAAGCGGAVFGMSGGIDSSVVAVLCKRAFPDDCLGVIMPCHSNPLDAEHATAVADKFSITTRVVPLDGANDALLHVLQDDGEPPEGTRSANANARVRLRMVTLYYLANRLGYLVVGTSNRSELATGYFTKYGDGGVDIEPLGNLVKRQVRELAAYLGVPQEIIDKPPTAGLWPGQTDEAELGITYDQLDDFLLSGEASEEVRARVEAIMAGSRHKLAPPPVPDF